MAFRPVTHSLVPCHHSTLHFLKTGAATGPFSYLRICSLSFPIHRMGPSATFHPFPVQELGKGSRGNPQFILSIVLCHSPVSPVPALSLGRSGLALSPQCMHEESPGCDLEHDTFPLWVAAHHANYTVKLSDEWNGWRHKPRRKICP